MVRVRPKIQEGWVRPWLQGRSDRGLGLKVYWQRSLRVVITCIVRRSGMVSAAMFDTRVKETCQGALESINPRCALYEGGESNRAADWGSMVWYVLANCNARLSQMFFENCMISMMFKFYVSVVT